MSAPLPASLLLVPSALLLEPATVAAAMLAASERPVPRLRRRAILPNGLLELVLRVMGGAAVLCPLVCGRASRDEGERLDMPGRRGKSLPEALLPPAADEGNARLSLVLRGKLRPDRAPAPAAAASSPLEDAPTVSPATATVGCEAKLALLLREPVPVRGRKCRRQTDEPPPEALLVSLDVIVGCS